MEACEHCEDSGIIGVTQQGVPITCPCEVGKNAKEANPDWIMERI